MRRWLGIGLLSLAGISPVAHAVNCTTQSAIQPAERDAIESASAQILASITAKDFASLQPRVLSSVAGDWEGIRSIAEFGAPLLEGGTIHWRSLYLLDASDLKAATDIQSFCTTVDGTLTVTLSLRSLPPGRYAIVLADAEGSAQAGQAGLIMGLDNTVKPPAWHLGGLFLRPGSIDGHDGVWYWTHARDLAKNGQALSAWYTYEAARQLLVPVSFLSSPNLDKLNEEQSHTEPEDPEGKQLPVTINGKTLAVTNLHLDLTLRALDLGFTYAATSGATTGSDPAAQRTEAIGFMSALLHSHPELREAFHGLWAYGEQNGTRTFAVELPMKDIP